MRGFVVSKAINGKTALEVATKEQFDIALVDLKMPGMNGQELLEVLKRYHKFIEVIILTGHGSLDSAVECTKLGAFGYLPKPYEIDKLLDTLRRAYEKRMRKKFEADQDRMDAIMQAAIGESPLGILRRLRELDDDAK
jgi:DNA-binding NtrC family response regulator